MKLRHELDKLRAQRNLLRQQRRKHEFPIVAVVGYTNAGVVYIYTLANVNRFV